MSETIRATFEADPDDFMKLDEEPISAALKESAIAEVIAELQLTEQDFQIADEMGLTREELIESEAYRRLTLDELIKRRDLGRSATEMLADRILRDKQRSAKADERKPSVSKASIKAAMATVEDELELTDAELKIAAQIGVTREEVMQQKARDRLTAQELKLTRAGLSPIEILAARIV